MPDKLTEDELDRLWATGQISQWAYDNIKRKFSPEHPVAGDVGPRAALSPKTATDIIRARTMEYARKRAAHMAQVRHEGSAQRIDRLYDEASRRVARLHEEAQARIDARLDEEVARRKAARLTRPPRINLLVDAATQVADATIDVRTATLSAAADGWRQVKRWARYVAWLAWSMVCDEDKPGGDVAKVGQ